MLNSPVDIAIVLGVALLIFGPKKLPELGKALGEGIGNFKRHLNDATDEVKSAMKTEPASPAVEEGATLSTRNVATAGTDDPRNSTG